MRRIVEENASERPAFGRGRALLVASLLGLASTARAGGGDGPELAPPTDMPIVSTPTTPTPAPSLKPSTVKAPSQRAVLAVPGVMTTPSRPSTAPDPSTTPIEPLDGELSLEAPTEMQPALPVAPSRTRSTATTTGRLPRPLVLESSPLGDSIPLDDPSSASTPSTKRPSTTRSQPTPAPARRRFFGLLPAPPMGRAPVAPKPSTAARSATENLRDDPAAESALKRRVERQAREAVGARVQSIEVRVIGKDVAIRVHGVRFYQKRAIRKSLETLPALSGLRSVIEVGD